ncbi:MAG: 50S ribosome-binding GTPase, partial [Planctomycetia bacterium]|nr:50S ribosome-binding GTPase [Planctomycetia bacterium]
IHAHGGTQVVKRLQKLFEDNGCLAKPADERPRAPVERARTLRTAAILLDQAHGAFERAVRDPRNLPRLAALAPVGRHLVVPWKVVIAGAPNAGKSSLVNAIAGFERSIVSPVAGTTRDVVTTFVALDGWPVELADTAGLRRATESLEAEGIALARRFLDQADLVVWLLDGTDPNPIFPDGGDPILVVNKCDRPPAFVPPVGTLPVSASTGAGIEGLIAAIVHRLVPVAPEPGEAVPYTPELADRVEAEAAHVRES